MSEARVKEIISETIGGCPLAAEELKAATRLGDELTADSLDIIEIAMAIEEEFGLSIGDDAIEEFETVGDITSYVALRLEERA